MSPIVAYWIVAYWIVDYNLVLTEHGKFRTGRKLEKSQQTLF